MWLAFLPLAVFATAILAIPQDINSNLPNRQVRATIMGALDSLLRAILGTLCAYWVVRSYTKRSFKIGVYLLDNYVLEYL